MADAVVAKLCSVCGIDCSAMKRSKDAQGRYICAECLERAREAKVAKEGKPIVKGGPVSAPLKVAAPLSPDGVDPILDGLVSQSKALDAKSCTECGFPMDKTSVVCTHCGFNTLTNSGTRVAVHKLPKEKSESEAMSRVRSNPMLFYAASMVSGALASAIGVALWSNFIQSAEITPTGIYLGRAAKFMSLLVGLLCGTGAYVGARGFSNVLTGAYAAIITAAAVMVGRYVGIVSMFTAEEVGGFFDVLPDLFMFMDILWLPFGMFVAYKIGSSGFQASL